MVNIHYVIICYYFYLQQPLFPFQGGFKDGEVLSAEVGPLNPGAVCLFGGFYTFLPLSVTSFDPTILVPYETCAIPASHFTGTRIASL